MDQDADASKGKEKVTTTPLIQFIKEKKANKSKENSGSAKSAKHTRQESKDGKPAAKESKKAAASLVTSPAKKRKDAEVKVETSTREAVGRTSEPAAISKKPVETQATSSAPVRKTTVPNVAPNATATAALAEKKRERGNAATAVKMLQRDLLNASSGGRGSRANKAANTPTGNGQSKSEKPVTPHMNGNPVVPVAKSPTPVVEDVPKAATSDDSSSNTGSSTLLQSATARVKGQAGKGPPQGNPAKASIRGVKPGPASASTQAFLKHANPSQGITEALLEEAFRQFGTIVQVEMDKKKGFAYIDYDQPQSLQAAILASPVTVAQSQLVVFESRTKGPKEPRTAKGDPKGDSKVGQSQPGRGPPASNSRGTSSRGGRGGSNRGSSKQALSAKVKPTSTTLPAATTSSSTVPVSNSSTVGSTAAPVTVATKTPT